MLEEKEFGREGFFKCGVIFLFKVGFISRFLVVKFYIIGL